MNLILFFFAFLFIRLRFHRLMDYCRTSHELELAGLRIFYLMMWTSCVLLLGYSHWRQ